MSSPNLRLHTNRGADLRTGPHNGHLLVHALRRHRDKPVLHIDGDSWTGQDLADRMSCFIQALGEVGVGRGSTVGLLALNRPEVLVSIGAGQLLGLRRRPCTRSAPSTTTPTCSPTPASRR